MEKLYNVIFINLIEVNMRKFLLITFMIFFSYSFTNADEFDKYDEELSRVELKCYAQDGKEYPFSTDTKNLYLHSKIIEVGSVIDLIADVTAVKKKDGENTFLVKYDTAIFGPGEIYLNFKKKRVKMGPTDYQVELNYY